MYEATSLILIFSLDNVVEELSYAELLVHQLPGFRWCFAHHAAVSDITQTIIVGISVIGKHGITSPQGRMCGG